MTRLRSPKKRRQSFKRNRSSERTNITKVEKDLDLAQEGRRNEEGNRRDGEWGCEGVVRCGFRF